MGYLLVFFTCLVGFTIFIRHDLTNPIIYYLIPWILCLFTYVIDLYDIKSQVSQEATTLVTIGTLGFVVGAFLIQKRFVDFFQKRPLKVTFRTKYRDWLVKLIIIFTAIFNFIMVIMVINLMRQGTSYSYIRDLLFSYNEDSTKFFTSKTMQNLYTIVDSPMTYCVAPVVVIEFFSQRLSFKYRLLSWLSIGGYIFATGGRLIIMFMMFQFIFSVGYYRKNVPWKIVGRVGLIIAVLILIAVVTTFYRKKDSITGATKVNSIYAYFNVNLPIFSRWLTEVDTSGIKGHGLAFFGGIFQFVDLVLNKIGIPFSSYEKVNELIELPQKNWVEVYSGNWFNAFDTMFYNLYVDFRSTGVFFGSLFLGLLSKWVYVLSTVLQNEKYILPALVMVEILASSFFRWQFGTFTFTGAFILSFFIFKNVSATEKINSK